MCCPVGYVYTPATGSHWLSEVPFQAVSMLTLGLRPVLEACFRASLSLFRLLPGVVSELLAK